MNTSTTPDEEDQDSGQRAPSRFICLTLNSNGPIYIDPISIITFYGGKSSYVVVGGVESPFLVTEDVNTILAILDVHSQAWEDYDGD